VARIGACFYVVDLFSFPDKKTPYRCYPKWSSQWLRRWVQSAENRTLDFDWSPQRRKTDEMIRCPYCAEDHTFKAMFRHHAGDWFICVKCGHLALPSSPFFQCTCGKCVALNGRFQSKSTSRYQWA